jgi:hypothetical protein
MKEGYRVWVYSGDVDANVPITGTLKWLHELREEYHVKINRPWREWWVHGRHPHEDQVGGMIWELQNLTFVSVRGAGYIIYNLDIWFHEISILLLLLLLIISYQVPLSHKNPFDDYL